MRRTTIADQPLTLHEIFAAISEARGLILQVRDRIDALAEITDRHISRIEGDSARIESGVNAIRADLHAFRMETRADFKSQNARILALEAR